MSRLSLAVLLTAIGFMGATFVGCDSSNGRLPPPDLGPEGAINVYAVATDYEFEDDIQSNREEDGTLGELEFRDMDGEIVRLKQYADDGKNVLLVFTRGFSGQLCPFCTTQTSRLIANYDEFTDRNTEVLLVYPGQKDQLGDFKAASTKAFESNEFPFPVLLDEDLSAVKRLDIAAQLALPSTFIIDTEGSVRLSYVGQNPADRPSIKALLAQLDTMQ